MDLRAFINVLYPHLYLLILDSNYFFIIENKIWDLQSIRLLANVNKGSNFMKYGKIFHLISILPLAVASLETNL